MGSSARDELVGHATLAVLALIGMALYSSTYALVYAGSSSARIVAILEFWMASVHLLSAGGCCVGQALAMSMLQLQEPIRHVAEAQTALFLGVSGAVATLSTNCINGESVDCGVYYGSAAVPRLAAVGAVVWSLLLYAGSLGCQSWDGGGISLGLRGASGLTASTVMLSVPWVIQGALVRVCGDAWRIHLCSAVRVQVDAAVTTSTITADCSHIDRSMGMSIGLALVALLLSWLGGLFAGRRQHFLTACGSCVAVVGIAVVGHFLRLIFSTNSKN
jgi:hypothetical protein